MVDIATHSLTDCVNNFIKFSSDIMQNMEYEWLRLASFSKFSNSSVSALRLAQTGFYYNGNGDEVTCFQCGLKHNNWRETDIPSEVHTSLSPNCSFLMRQHKNVSNGELHHDIASSRRQQIGVTSSGNTVDQITSSGNTVDQITSSGNTVNQITSSRDTVDQITTSDCPLEIDYVTNSNGTSLYSHGPIMSPSEVTDNSQRITGSCGGQNVGSSFSQTFSNNSVSVGSASAERGLHVDDVLTFPSCTSSSRQSCQSSSRRLNTETQTRHGNNRERKTQMIANSQRSEMMEPLGISFDKPVHQHFAVLTVRLNSFQAWPKHLTQTPHDLSRAGFFYEGTGDKVYCFFCGGGLFNWDPGDDPWEEHARWFPKCVFLRQCKGDEFVMKVQMEKERAELMTTQDGIEANRPNQNGFNPEPVSFSHPAVVSVLGMGYKPTIIRQALEAFIRSEDQTNLTAELLLMKIWSIEEEDTRGASASVVDIVQPGTKAEHGIKEDTRGASANVVDKVQPDTAVGCGNKPMPKPSHTVTDDGAEQRAILEENRQLKELQTCKICLDEEVSIVFLPCGHMAACVSCAPALRKCPICRSFIKGTVKAIIS